MSGKAAVWAWQQTGIPPLEKLVLLALAERHNKDTGKCYPSMTLMAEDTGMSRRSVMRAIRGLEERGLITCDRTYGKSTFYHLHIGKLTIETTGDRESPVTESHQLPVTESHRCQSVTGDRESPPLVTESHRTGDRESPEPKKNLKVEPKRKRQRKVDPLEVELPTSVNSEAWAEWWMHKGGNYPQGTVTKNINLMVKYSFEPVSYTHLRAHETAYTISYAVFWL